MISARIITVIAFISLTFVVGCKEEAPPEGPVASILTLTVQAGPQVSLDGEAIELAEIEAILRAEAQKQTTYVVYDIAPDAPAATFQKVFQQVNNAGVAGVRFASEDGAQTFHRPTLAAR
jgi:biopolymer transport protein ExbD